MDRRNILDKVNQLVENAQRTREVTVVQKPKRGSFLRGTFIGAAFGAVAGLLLAPRTGRQTRRQLGKRSNQLRRQATSQAGELRQRASRTAGKVNRRVDRTVRQAKRATRRK